MVHLKLIKKENEALLYIDGRIDSNSAPDLEKKLMALTPRFDRITLDLARVSYVSSAGLRVLKKLRLAMQDKGGCELRNVSDGVIDVMRATGFDRVFRL